MDPWNIWFPNSFIALWFFQVFKCIFKNTKNYINIKDPKDANDSSDDPKTPRVKVDQVEFISLSEFDTVPKYMKVNTLILTNGKV